MGSRSAFPIMGLLVGACSPTAHLDPLPLETLEAQLAAPTGALEETDALGLAYAILGTDVALSATLVAATELPGVRRSPHFALVEVASCGQHDEQKMIVDYPCLGFPAGQLGIVSDSLTPNENGDYELSLEAIDLGAGAEVDGSALMRVEGVANPTTTERALLSPIAHLEAFPERFAELSRVGLRIGLTRGAEEIEGVAEILGETFSFRFTDTNSPAGALYSVRDARNLWTCRSERDGRQILKSECKTPVGHGDFAVLRF
jgi:hypothetical protein